jgi:hypothetical protein
VGLAFLTICAVVALSGTNANAAAAIPGRWCVFDDATCDSHSYTYGAGQKSTWAVTCDGGNVDNYSGESLCSSTAGTYLNTGNPFENDGQYCWCRITSVNGGDVSGSWVAHHNVGSASNCASICALLCGGNVWRRERLQRALFTGLGITPTPAPIQPTIPTICDDHTSNGPGAEGSWEVKNCTGSDVTSFTGFSRCSSTPGTWGNPGNPVAGGDRNCWCKITSVKPNGAAGSSWVFEHRYGTAGDCETNCSKICGIDAGVNNILKSGLFSTLKTKSYACMVGLLPTSPTGCKALAPGNPEPETGLSAQQRATWDVWRCVGSNVEGYSGESLCSSTPGSQYTPGDPSDINGIYCWCRITNISSFGAVLSSWVFRDNLGSKSNCGSYCSYRCYDSGVSEYKTLRSALFDAIGS